jgi:hypothetical protein
MQFPEESVMMVVPPGPLVEPVTRPLPAVTDAERPPASARPFFVVTTLQPDPLPETVALELPPPTLTELLELTWAIPEAAPNASSATDRKRAFMTDLPW